MPYTTTQIADQQLVVDLLKEDINWKKDVSYDFQGLQNKCPKFNGTRTEYWAQWRTDNPDAVSSGQTWDASAQEMTGTFSSDENADLMYDWWQWEMYGETGYEVDDNGSWATYISDKETELATEEATLATMKADPA